MVEPLWKLFDRYTKKKVLKKNDYNYQFKFGYYQKKATIFFKKLLDPSSQNIPYDKLMG